MRLSQIIKELQSIQRFYGDVDVYQETGDGRSTWVEPYEVDLQLRGDWPLRNDEKKWIMK